MANAPASMRLQRASAGTLSAATVVERRAADVLVLGDSALASAACISLARKGKKASAPAMPLLQHRARVRAQSAEQSAVSRCRAQVIHVPDMGLQAPRPAREALKPLIIPHPSAELTRYARHTSHTQFKHADRPQAPQDQAQRESRFAACAAFLPVQYGSRRSLFLAGCSVPGSDPAPRHVRLT